MRTGEGSRNSRSEKTDPSTRRNITLRITARKDPGQKIDWPFISTPEHWITPGIHTNLHDACRMAARKAIRFLENYYGMPEDDAYAFCSMGVDLRVTQVANFAHGIHAMIPKHAFVGEQFASKNNLLLQAGNPKAFGGRIYFSAFINSAFRCWSHALELQHRNTPGSSHVLKNLLPVQAESRLAVIRIATAMDTPVIRSIPEQRNAAA